MHDQSFFGTGCSRQSTHKLKEEKRIATEERMYSEQTIIEKR